MSSMKSGKTRERRWLLSCFKRAKVQKSLSYSYQGAKVRIGIQPAPKCSIQPREQRIRAAWIRAVLPAPLGCRGQGSLSTLWLLLQPFCAVLAGLLTAKSDIQQLASLACKEADRGCFTFPLALAFFSFVPPWSLCHILAWAAQIQSEQYHNSAYFPSTPSDCLQNAGLEMLNLL